MIMGLVRTTTLPNIYEDDSSLEDLDALFADLAVVSDPETSSEEYDINPVVYRMDILDVFLDRITSIVESSQNEFEKEFLKLRVWTRLSNFLSPQDDGSSLAVPFNS